MKMSGMKKRPLRAAAIRLARIGLRMVCVSMLVSTMVATNGELITCQEGVASMTAVLQDEMRMSEAMNNYLTAYYRYKVANLSLLKLTGQLNQISVAK